MHELLCLLRGEMTDAPQGVDDVGALGRKLSISAQDRPGAASANARIGTG